jgi:hypothetical protein
MKIKPRLTPLGASGLVIIMIGATVLSIPHGVAMAAFSSAAGILATLHPGFDTTGHVPQSRGDQGQFLRSL